MVVSLQPLVKKIKAAQNGCLEDILNHNSFWDKVLGWTVAQI